MRAASIHWYLCYMYDALGDTAAAREQMLYFLDNALQGTDTGLIAEAYRSYASVIEATDPDHALAYHLKALETALSADNPVQICAARMALGRFLHRRKENEKAISELRQALEIARSKKITWLEVHAILDLAMVLEESGQREETHELRHAALQLAERLGDKGILRGHSSGYGAAYSKANRTIPAYQHFHAAVTLARELQLLRTETDALEGLLSIHTKDGRTDSAIHYLELYLRYDDSLEQKDQSTEVIRLSAQMEYRSAQIEDSLMHAAQLVSVENARTIERLRADRNRNRAMGLGGGGILLVAGIGAYTVSDRKRRKAKFEQQAAQLETKALRAQMDPHFLYNSLNSISAYVQVKDVDSAVSYLARAARLMRLTLENSRSQEISLEQDLKAVEAYLHLERDRADGRFDYTIQIDPGVDREQTMVPPMVLQPFVENAIIHGFTQRATQGSITIHAEAHNGKLLLRVEDNGGPSSRCYQEHLLRHRHHPRAPRPVEQDEEGDCRVPVFRIARRAPA
ncbi:MAG: histidine kinase [Flavobacteriales bacterium]|nr:histidine kinase [Flavobacteriales bacterium]